jgi:hypothetical protein
MSLLARGVLYKFSHSMALVVNRPKLSLVERLYLPAILGGLAITLKHLKKLIFGETKVTMQYPEERWDSHLPSWYRGAPALVKDELPTLRVHLPAAGDYHSA